MTDKLPKEAKEFVLKLFATCIAAYLREANLENCKENTEKLCSILDKHERELLEMLAAGKTVHDIRSRTVELFKEGK